MNNSTHQQVTPSDLVTAQRLQAATALLKECDAGFSAYINGRKMARKERDALRAEITIFLLAEQRRLAAANPTP